jgi:threonine synthase
VAPGAGITLGEGQTPLLACARLGKRLGLDRLWVKDETRQPPGSFKDRPLSVAVSRARQDGFDTRDHGVQRERGRRHRRLRRAGRSAAVVLDG